MRIEFKVYTTRRQKAFIHGLKRALFALLGALLPFGEVAGAILLILSMCCMDSDNFMPCGLLTDEAHDRSRPGPGAAGAPQTSAAPQDSLRLPRYRA